MQTQITGGAFQDTLGNPLALGYLTWQLNKDGSTTSLQVSAGRLVQVSLDGDGNILGTVLIWPNDQLSPSDTVYIVKAYSTRGQLVWQSTLTIPTSVDPYPLEGALPA